MRVYDIVFRRVALDDIDGIAQYIGHLYRPDSGHRYRQRILSKIHDLTFSADALPYSHRPSIKQIHPKAKTLSIMNRRWTVVFHIEEEYVIVDRLLFSPSIKD